MVTFVYFPSIYLIIVHQSAKKDKILLEWVVSTSTAKHILKGVLVTKGKLKPDVNIISDLIRDEKYVDNNIHIFHLLWGLIWKNINRKVLWRFCMDRVFETLQQEKKFKMVLFGLSENDCHEYSLGSMWPMFKMESFKLHIPQNLPKVDIAKLILKIIIGNRVK